MSSFEERYTSKLCTREEASALVRKTKKAAFFVRGGTFLVTEELAEGKARGFDGMTNVKVSKATALKYIDDILSERLQARGAKIKVTAPNDMSEMAPCIFIGV